tara:strand:- start:1085 stop:1303 length:219 start_codon:yes stop_codon:yes gene_type:complete
MDISLIKTLQGTQLIPCSVHGMLWLQTHFEEEHWDEIANENVKIDNLEALELAQDAQAAGLILQSVPVISSN